MNLDTVSLSALLSIITFEMMIMNGHCSSISVTGSERKKMQRSSRDSGRSNRSKQQRESFVSGASHSQGPRYSSYVYSATGMQGPFSAEQAAESASNPFTWNALARETQNINQWQTKGKAKVETSQQGQSKRTPRWLYLAIKMMGGGYIRGNTVYTSEKTPSDFGGPLKLSSFNRLLLSSIIVEYL